MLFFTCFPVVTAAVAVIMDLRTAKVDNGWILFTLVIGLWMQITEKGLRGIPVFFAGAVFPVICLGILFFLRMLGPGDIKLFCALGGVMGMEKIGICMLVSFFAGACISAAILLSNGEWKRRCQYLTAYVRDLVCTGQIRPYYKKGMNTLENFHFTVPVFLSVALYAGGLY